MDAASLAHAEEFLHSSTLTLTFIYSHLDVRGLADPKAQAAVLLLAAGSGTKASVQRKAR